MNERPKHSNGIFIGKFIDIGSNFSVVASRDSNIHINDFTRIGPGVGIYIYDEKGSVDILSTLKSLFVEPQTEQINELITDLKSKKDITEIDVKDSILDKGLRIAKEVGINLAVQTIMLCFSQ